MILAVLGHDFAYEMECVTRLFYPAEKILRVKDGQDFGGDAIITQITKNAAEMHFSVRVKLGVFDKTAAQCADLPQLAGECERRLGLLLFGLLCEHTNYRPAWGILTGIRPVRLCRQWAAQGMDETAIFRRLQEDYLVLPEKIQLTLATEKNQRQILAAGTPQDFSLYISIPFCPTRCLYCSFVSHAIEKTSKLLPEYVEHLCKELVQTAKLAKSMELRLRTVYMGGGTPTTLEAAQLKRILATVRDSFDLSGVIEYTVEAGRPDTVTQEKLDVLREFGVGRISINPQTMNDTVLQKIGRKHSARQTVQSYELAQKTGFAAVNMDLIAGLPGDSPESFYASLDQIIALAPENITVHTLTVKRSSNLREQQGAFAHADLNALLRTARQRLCEAGYEPYYLYRQKATVENLENVGFTKAGHACVYNIYTMEETHSILAAGAGGVSKICHPNGEIDRIANFKYPYEYLSRFAEILQRKSEELYSLSC